MTVTISKLTAAFQLKIILLPSHENFLYHHLLSSFLFLSIVLTFLRLLSQKCSIKLIGCTLAFHRRHLVHFEVVWFVLNCHLPASQLHRLGRALSGKLAMQSRPVATPWLPWVVLSHLGGLGAGVVRIRGTMLTHLLSLEKCPPAWSRGGRPLFSFWV